MKQLISLLFIAAIQILPAMGQSKFTGTFLCEETGLRLHLDLDSESIQVPGMSFLGETHGYLDGKTNNHVYGVWMLIRHSEENNKAKLRFTNDIGSDSQDIVLTWTNDSTLEYNALGGNAIRKVEGRKLVKIPSTMILHRVNK